MWLSTRTRGATVDDAIEDLIGHMRHFHLDLSQSPNVKQLAENHVLYAQGSFGFTLHWFVVRVLVIRHDTIRPRIKVKFVSRLDGSDAICMLPSPSIDWVFEVFHA